jgi:hypothetical protein
MMVDWLISCGVNDLSLVRVMSGHKGMNFFKSLDKHVRCMGPARFHCATLLPCRILENLKYVECNKSVLKGIRFH